jgi:hypothetical protein
LLPFLKKDRAVGGLTIKTREPDQTNESQEDPDSDLHSGASEMLSAIAANDHKRLASAMKDMHTMLSSRDDQSENDFDEQNAAATKGAF